jgi:hypothetical protein
MSNFSKNSSEYLVQKTLNELIKKVANDIYTDECKAGPDFLNEKCKLETLGIIISKYAEWDGNQIKTIAEAAFEDSNFNIEIDLN